MATKTAKVLSSVDATFIYFSLTHSPVLNSLMEQLMLVNYVAKSLLLAILIIESLLHSLTRQASSYMLSSMAG